MTCHEAEIQLELYAASECDEPDRTAVAQHLAGCPACAQALRETQQFLGRLDLHFHEAEQLARLRARIENEPRRQAAPRRVLPFVRRATALAAMLLLTVGLSQWLEMGDQAEQGSGNPPLLTLVAHGRGEVEAMKTVPGPDRFHELALKRGMESKAVVQLDLGGKTPQEFRNLIEAAKKTDRLPKPPALDLEIVLHNPSARPMQVWTEGDGTQLTLDLHGPGVVDATADVSRREPGTPPTVVTVPPRKSHTLKITSLEYDVPGGKKYFYWTEPGDYTLTARFQTAISPAPPGSRPVPGADGKGFGSITLTSAPVPIKVEAK